MSEEQENTIVEPEESINSSIELTEELPKESAEQTESTPIECTDLNNTEEPIVTENYEQPQVIVQRERGFAHYVGFALISVLCIFFFFMPGIAITFLVSLIPSIALGAIAACTFTAIFSIISWTICKIKIHGFKKSFYVYIGVCIAIFAILTAIHIMTEINVFGKIIALLCGADAT